MGERGVWMRGSKRSMRARRRTVTIDAEAEPEAAEQCEHQWTKWRRAGAADDRSKRHCTRCGRKQLRREEPAPARTPLRERLLPKKRSSQ